MAETILLTGFGPFGEHTRNLTEAVVRRLDGAEREGFVVRGLPLPVQFERAVALLEEAVASATDGPPAAVICCGIHGDADGPIRLELAARNERDYPIPDAEGQQARGEVVERDGPPMVFSTLPVAAIKQAFDDAGIPAVLSEDAGHYLCNAVFYWTARRLRPAGFLHVPPALAREDEVLRAIDLAVDTTARRLAAQRVEASA